MGVNFGVQKQNVALVFKEQNHVQLDITSFGFLLNLNLMLHHVNKTEGSL